MSKAPGGERISEWTFTETLSLDDIEIRERQQVEDGELCVVPYAHSVQGRETSKIAYRELRKICGYLGVRYYKNRTKGVMLEIIAQHKLKGRVPESYRMKTERKKQVELPQSTIEDEDVENRGENRDSIVEAVEAHVDVVGAKRQRVSMDESPGSTTPPTALTITTDINATNTFLQPMSPHESDQHESPSTEYESGIPTTPVDHEPPRTRVEMSLTDRVDTFNLLRHIRQQIQHVEEELALYDQILPSAPSISVDESNARSGDNEPDKIWALVAVVATGMTQEMKQEKEQEDKHSEDATHALDWHLVQLLAEAG
ncbi:Hypothetical protein PHPALM_4577, partial [Phytophthora palmivora]